MTKKENESKAQNSTASDSDTFYIFYNSPDFNYGGIIKNISHVIFQGMECIKGVTVGEPDNGRVMYIPIQHIHMLIEYDSYEDLKKTENTGKKRFGFWNKK